MISCGAQGLHDIHGAADSICILHELRVAYWQSEWAEGSHKQCQPVLAKPCSLTTGSTWPSTFWPQAKLCRHQGAPGTQQCLLCWGCRQGRGGQSAQREDPHLGHSSPALLALCTASGLLLRRGLGHSRHTDPTVTQTRGVRSATPGTLSSNKGLDFALVHL